MSRPGTLGRGAFEVRIQTQSMHVVVKSPELRMIMRPLITSACWKRWRLVQSSMLWKSGGMQERNGEFKTAYGDAHCLGLSRRTCPKK